MATINFVYDREKDIWCLLNKGKNSNNSQTATKVYEELIAAEGDDPTPEAVSNFIDAYIADKGIDIPEGLESVGVIIFT